MRLTTARVTMVGMARPTLLHLTEQQHAELLQAAEQTTDADFRDMCRALLLLDQGKSRAEVAAFLVSIWRRLGDGPPCIVLVGWMDCTVQ